MLALLAVLVAGQVQEAPRPLEWNPALDLSLTAGMATFWLVTEIPLKSALAPPSCRVCGPNDFDSAARRWFVPAGSTNRMTEDTASNVLVAFAPVLLAGVDGIMVERAGGDWRDWATDFLLMSEAVAAAMSVNQTLKFIVGRERPYVSDLSASQKVAAKDSDANLSLFSGHTTLAASLAGAAGTIAWLRGYRHPWIAWVIGGSIAVATAMLRMSADKHWLSDVLLGLAFGGAVGVGTPLLFHGRAMPVNVALGPNGVVVSVRF
jgi:hypothetical protein